jgi:hypothetical protein
VDGARQGRFDVDRLQSHLADRAGSRSSRRRGATSRLRNGARRLRAQEEKTLSETSRER